MPHFKDKNGELYWLEPDDVPVWKGKTWEEVSDEEAQAIRAAKVPPINRKAQINARLTQIDMESIRSLRAVGRGKAVKADADKLDQLETEAAALRAELAAMG